MLAASLVAIWLMDCQRRIDAMLDRLSGLPDMDMREHEDRVKWHHSRDGLHEYVLPVFISGVGFVFGLLGTVGFIMGRAEENPMMNNLMMINIMNAGWLYLFR